MPQTKTINLETISKLEIYLDKCISLLDNLDNSEKSGKTARISENLFRVLVSVRKELNRSAAVEVTKRLKSGEINATDLLKK